MKTFNHNSTTFLKSTLFIILSLFLASTSFGQERKTLENKRKKILKEIRSTNRLLSQTSKDRMAALDRYVALEQQIKKRGELIETLHEELEYANQSLERTSNVVFSLEEDMTRLEKEYGVLARSALRQRSDKSNLAFIFSSVDFNQALQRWQYLKQYNAYRKRQANLIVETQGMLEDKMAQLEERKAEKETFIEETEKQSELLAKELNDKSSLLAALKRDESRLKKELNKNQKAHAQLNDAIEKVIQSEIVASRKRSRSREAINQPKKKSSDTSTPSRTPKAPVVTSDFAKNQGRLPWPVTSGVIIKRFGKQAHPTIKSIQITNNGIDIQTSANAQVQCVYQGEVVGKQFIPGYDNMLIIRHGNYYTVYSNLKEVFVKKGDSVKMRQAIGIASQKGNVGQVHFEVWQDKKRLNPARWITR